MKKFLLTLSLVLGFFTLAQAADPVTLPAGTNKWGAYNWATSGTGFKATNVDGVFDKDPNKYPDAVKYDVVTHSEVLEKDLKVMDSTAASLCRDNNIPILVFNLSDPENIIRAVLGENVGTLVKEG